MRKLILTLLGIFFTQISILGQAPENDLIQNATLVTESPFTDSRVHFNYATPGDGGQNGCNLGSYLNTVYYKFTATSTNTITIAIEDFYGDEFVIVYSAPNLNATSDSELTSVTECSFDNVTSFTPTVGTNYYVLAHSESGGTTSITIDIPQSIPVNEKLALQDLYNNTNGGSWVNQTNWNTSNFESSWYGVTIKNGHISKLILDSNNLNGNIPESIVNLSFLEELNLKDNHLYETLPNLGTISTIESVNVSKNDFSFADLETNYTTNNTIGIFNYQTQNNRDTEMSFDGVIGNHYSFSMTPIEGTNVTYQWYKKRIRYFDISDEPVSGGDSNILNIPNLQGTDMDIYYCTATSPSIPDLMINRSTVEIKGEVSQAEKDALIAIYNSTNGDNWNDNTHWLSDEPLSEWHGVTISGNKITQLNLASNNLIGTLPPEIGDLVNLEFLSFYSGNNLYGTIPEEIGNLTELRVLSLESNFTGTIPDSFANLTKLRGLWLSGANFEGNVPDYFATNYPNLVFLGMWKNHFQGTLPDFTNLEKLQYLEIAKNHFRAEDFSAQLNEYLNLRYSWNSPSYYSPQYTLDPEEAINESAGATVSLFIDESLYERGSLLDSNTTYTWYKDGIIIENSNANPYVITNAQTTDSGVYHCILNNSEVPNLENIRNNITVNIQNLGVNDQIINGIKLYPNPTNDVLVVKLPNHENSNLNLFDLNGRLLLNKTLNSNETIIDLSSFENGVYILDLNINNLRLSKKIIKK